VRVCVGDFHPDHGDTPQSRFRPLSWLAPAPRPRPDPKNKISYLCVQTPPAHSCSSVFSLPLPRLQLRRLTHGMLLSALHPAPSVPHPQPGESPRLPDLTASAHHPQRGPRIFEPMFASPPRSASSPQRTESSAGASSCWAALEELLPLSAGSLSSPPSAGLRSEIPRRSRCAKRPGKRGAFPVFSRIGLRIARIPLRGR